MPPRESDIAIIGMAGRFPGASHPDGFWDNLCAGVESISQFSAAELAAAGVAPELLRNPKYVRAGGTLEGVGLFDAGFFGFSPKEAELLDPQQRLFLECAWEALERAGYDPAAYGGAIGVYAGAGVSLYLLRHLYNNPAVRDTVTLFQLMVACTPDSLPGRVAYKLDLKGPAVAIQTGCSTSLVAVHMACQALRAGECDMALAGGVTIGLLRKTGYLHQEGMVLSPDGHCRAFDEQAEGTVPSSGLGIVVLKPAVAALADGDYIHALILGSAINNDGAAKVSFTAPGVDGQAAAIAEAHAVAGVDVGTIAYVETHGTATALGDLIEMAALTRAFRRQTDRSGFCAIGSVKSNIGHLDIAAGVAGLIKTVLALEHHAIPPSLHFKKANPKIDFAASPFFVNARLAEWPAGDVPRRAGVSSFGIGGTNAHMVLEEAPPAEPRAAEPRSCELLVLSARTPAALDSATANLVQYLERHPEVELCDAACTLAAGRRGFVERRMLVAANREEALAALRTSPGPPVKTGRANQSAPSVAFLFSGQGSQHVHMGRELYRQEPVFRECVDHCAERLRPDLGMDLRQILYPAADCEYEAARQMLQTAIAQPAIFVIEYALTELWASWGVRPSAALGHSIGEYVAACVAGVMPLSDALALVAARGRMMQQMPAGAMLAVPLSPADVAPLIGSAPGGELSLAAVNGPAQCVVSGSPDAISAFERALAGRGIEGRRLNTSHAFHSHLVEPILEPFARRVAAIALQPPQIPFLSNVTGAWITAEEATSPDYWSRHLRVPVQFACGLERLFERPSQILLEVGPGRTLATLAMRHPKKAPQQLVLASLPRAEEAPVAAPHLLGALGEIWLRGAKVDWHGFYARRPGRRVPLTTYPFERERYWVEPTAATLPEAVPSAARKQPDVADWFSVPSWKRAPVMANGAPPSTALMFMDACGVGAALAQLLESRGHRVIAVEPGASPRSAQDFADLLYALAARGEKPQTIVHALSLTRDPHESRTLETLPRALDCGFHSLLHLAQVLVRQTRPLPRLLVLSNGAHQVSGDEILHPAQATLLGPVKAIAKEAPELACRNIDVVVPEPGTPEAALLAAQLFAECSAPANESVVAYRGAYRWVPAYEPVRLESRECHRLRQRGVYLITGGFGGIGLALARYLADSLQARLVLLGRNLRPEPALRAMEQAGAEVLAIAADVADEPQMRAAIAAAHARFGAIHGVIHAAGVPGGGLLETLSPETAARTLAAKVGGTLILEKLLRDTPLDFLVLCSSLSSILPGLGQADYCAANAFLDAFAAASAVQPAISINWDGWKQVGMAAEAARRFGRELNGDQMEPDEGVEAFRRVLEAGLPQVLVSTAPFQEEWARRRAGAVARQPTKPSASHARPALNGSYVAPGNPLEQAVAEVWQEFLGVERVGIHDRFLELGGDSLVATQIVARLRERLAPGLPISVLFDTPTVAGIAACLPRFGAVEAHANGRCGQREEIIL